jgi:hypothetical protein
MWISPSFNLKVIRTFDAVMTGNAAAVDTLIPSEVQTLHEVIDRRVASVPDALRGRAYGETYTRLQNRFRVNSYKLLPRTQLAEALVYVATLELQCAPAVPEPAPVETLSQRQYAELQNLLRPGHWILQPEWVRLAMHDHVRSTLNVRHLKDIPADQFDAALIVARDTAARADLIGDVLQTALQELTREVIAAGAPCTQVLVREWKKRFKDDVPKYPDWLEIQRQLQAATTAPVLALD